MRAKDGYRQGVFDLLMQLKDQPLLRNTPSENMAHGIRSSEVTDETTLNRIEKNMLERGGTSATMSKKRAAIEEALAKGDVDDVDIEFSDGAHGPSYFGTGSHLSGPASKRAKDTSVPEFLRNSRVQGGREAMEEAERIRLARVAENGIQADGATTAAQTEATAKSEALKALEDADDWED